MRIKSIKALALGYKKPNDFNAEWKTVLRRIEITDGISACRENIASRPETCKADSCIIDDGLAPLIVASKAYDVNRLWARMKAYTRRYGDYSGHVQPSSRLPSDTSRQSVPLGESADRLPCTTDRSAQSDIYRYVTAPIIVTTRRVNAQIRGCDHG